MSSTGSGSSSDRPRVAVTGATGKTGRALTASLLARGGTVRALARDPGRVTCQADGTGAGGVGADSTRLETAQVDLGDPTAGAALAAALHGCDALYLVAPNLFPDEPGMVRRLLAAARATGVDRVVYHSVAQPYAPAMPHHVDKAVAEDEVRRSGLRWTVLQPCAYTQNLLAGLRGSEPALTVPYSLDTPFSLVDLLDVAEVAATVLTADGHDGATYELGGPGPVSVRQVAAMASAVLGRPVPATSTSPEAAGAGLDPQAGERLRAMFGYYDRYGLLAGSVATRAVLGRPPSAVPQVLRRELTGADGAAAPASGR